MMRAADLRDRVGFYQRAMISDGYGNSVGEFPDDPEFTCAANIKPRLGGESVLAARLQSTNLANITVRWSVQTKHVTSEWMLKDERTGEIYNILSPIDPEQSTSKRRKWVELLCEKGVAT